MTQTELEKGVGEVLIDEDVLQARIRELGAEPMEVLARVVHRTASHRATSPVETGGMGLELINAPESFYKLLVDLGVG